jgi:hypothetical protein
LTTSEWTLLAEHLKKCTTCREELPKYQEIATSGIALLAPSDLNLEDDKEWSPDTAVAQFMRRMGEEEIEQSPAENQVVSKGLGLRQWLRGISFPRLNVALPYVATAVALIAISVSLYFFGIRKGETHVNAHPQAATQLGSTLDALLRERLDLERQLQLRSAEIAKITEQLNDEKAEVDKWQALKRVSDETVGNLEKKSKAQEAENAAVRSQNQVLAEDQVALTKKLQESETSVAATQRKLESIQDQHAADLVQLSKLEAEVANAARQPQVRAYVEPQTEEPVQRDLRDLMGARDLFIADVYDFDKAGSLQKPFGRVFYTQGKSLVFYAFDLDRQPGVRVASSFQVWGRHGFGDNRPLNMGVMYLESGASKRWVLKFSDAKALSQIDAVFVTLEPRGGSDMPKGRQLLYASLRTPPNHP